MAIKYFGDERYPARTEYVGCVLSTRSVVERVMSDIYADCYYATVWDDAVCKVVELMTNSAFECYTDPASAKVDATDETKAKVAAYYEGRAYAHKIANAEAAIEKAKRVAAYKIKKAEADAKTAAKRKDIEAKREAIEVSDKTPTPGDTIEVTRGNKSTKKGTVGKVFWGGWSKGHAASWRIGFDADGVTHWIAASGVKVTEKGEPEAPAPKVEAAAAPEVEVEKGDKVEVVTGGDAGMVGKIIWVGCDKRTGAPRVGVKATNGKVCWTAGANVKEAS